LGFYYGHTYILPWESELKLLHDPLRGESEAAGQPDVDQHLAMMVALVEFCYKSRTEAKKMKVWINKWEYSMY
jgi:hypothetical protein